MRTAKKTLCLVLVLAMMLSMCVFASADADVTKVEDYTDYEDIPAVYKQAATILTALEVFQGYGGDDDQTGTFSGENKLTRAQGAKIISVMLGFKDGMTTNTLSQFSDMTDDHWANAYVNAGVQRGIIAGYGDGRFGPEDPLTGTQFAKMLLTALGYKADKEGLVGPGWDVNTAILANSADSIVIPNEQVYGPFGYTENIDRFTAAQMSFMTLLLPLVKYDGDNWEFETSANRASQTISSAVINGSTQTYMVEFAERYFPGLERTTQKHDDFGAPRTDWKLNGKEVMKAEAAAVWEDHDGATGEDVDDVISSLKLGNSRYEVSKVTVVWVDGIQVGSGNSIYDWIVKGEDEDISDRGTEVKVYYDADVYYNDAGYTSVNTGDRGALVTVVIKHTWLAEVIADATDEEVKLGVITSSSTSRSNGAEIVTAEEGNFAGLKESDLVYVTAILKKNGEIDEVKSVDKCESDIDVEISEYIKDKDTSKMDKATFDDETVEVAEKALYNSDILNDYKLEQLIGYTYDLYYDSYGYLLGIEFNKTDNSYVFVAGVEVENKVLSAKTYKANVIWTDGTFETIDVECTKSGTAGDLVKSEVDNDKYGNSALNTWFICTKNADGKVTLKDVVGQTENTNNTKQYQNIEQAATKAYSGQDEDISEAKLSLRYTADGSKFANGNDSTVYILAEGSVEDITGGAIVDAGDVIKGVKNVSVKCVDLLDKGYTNFATPTPLDGTGNREEYSDTFFIYNAKTNVVMYAVTVAESVSKDFVYITSDAISRKMVNNEFYVNKYEAIVDGELTTIEVNTNECEVDGVGPMKLFAVRYDKDGNYIIEMTEKATSTMHELTQGKLKSNGYAIIRDIKFDTALYLDADNTLNIDIGADLNSAIRTNSDTKVYVADINDATENDDYEGPMSAARGIDYAQNKGTVNTVYAVINTDNGYAEYIVFLYTDSSDMVPLTVNGVDANHQFVAKLALGGAAARYNSANAVFAKLLFAGSDDNTYAIQSDSMAIIVEDNVANSDLVYSTSNDTLLLKPEAQGSIVLEIVDCYDDGNYTYTDAVVVDEDGNEIRNVCTVDAKTVTIDLSRLKAGYSIQLSVQWNKK